MCCIKKITVFLFGLLFIPTAFSQINVIPDSLASIQDTDSLHTLRKNGVKAATYVFATNIGVWTFDRFILDGSFARINLSTMKENIKTGFVWDNDMFSTNLFAHPYHGGTYFNSARSNGMNFWQSVPYAVGGSLMWEYLMENEPGAINDFVATTIGGAALGEITFRISDLIIDDRAVGFDRFKREALLTVISPLRGINRIISGDAWKHRNIRGHTIPKVPVMFYTSIGHRIIQDNSQRDVDISNMLSYHLGMYYGNPFSVDNEHPYDFFSIKMSGNLFSQQPLIDRFNVLGMLISKDIILKNPKRQLSVGLFQHFNYYQSQADINNVSLFPYKISEAASAGPGLLYMSKPTKHTTFSCSFFLSGILLGGSQTDHFKYDKRDYNMGSGFSSKLNLEMQWGEKIRFVLNSEDYRLYSWVGYDPNNNGEISSNVQGDKGHSSLSVVRLSFNYIIKKHLLLSTETSFNYRESIYDYYSPVYHSVKENKISIGYIF